MAVKVGINGFRRIGRLTLRRIQDVDGAEVITVNDLTDAKMLVYLLRYDTIQGRFNGIAEAHGDSFNANGKKVKVLANRNPEELSWGELGVDIVLECAGFFTSRSAVEKHLTAGTKRVVISAPGENDIPTIIYNTSYETLTGKETIISGASCTTNCSIPVAETLNDKFGVVEGLMMTIHAYTGDQVTLDRPHPKGDFHHARAAAANIVPSLTGAARAIGLVIPKLSGKLDGVAQHVPVLTGSLTELIIVLEKEVTVDEINTVVKKASNESYGYNTDEIVSPDVVGMAYGSLLSTTRTEVMTVGDKQLVKTVAWYDNEVPYAAQLVCTLEYFVSL